MRRAFNLFVLFYVVFYLFFICSFVVTLAQLLLEKGANIHAQDNNKRNTLSLADTFCGRNSEMTKYLVKKELELKKQNGPYTVVCI